MYRMQRKRCRLRRRQLSPVQLGAVACSPTAPGMRPEAQDLVPEQWQEQSKLHWWWRAQLLAMCRSGAQRRCRKDRGAQRAQQ